MRPQRQASGLPIDKCEVYRHHLGGGFGRRATSHDFVRYAVLIAKQMPGIPIKMIWSREEDMTHGVYHPDHAVPAGRRPRRQRQPRPRCTCAFRASRSSPASIRNALQNGRDPVDVPGPQPARAGRPVRLHDPEPADRPRDAQPACAAGLLARRQQQPECDLSRVLHRRAGACGQAGSAGVPPQADGQPSQAPRGAERGRRERRLGQAAPARRASRHRPAHGLRQLCRRLRGSLGQRRRRAEDPSHRRRDRLRHTRSTRSRSRRRSKARSSTA